MPDSAAARPSLSSALLARSLVPIAAIWLSGAVLAFYVTRGIVGTAFDHDLSDTALAVASALRVRDGRPDLAVGSRALDLLLYSGTGSTFFAVSDAEGTLVAGNPGMPAPLAPPPPGADAPVLEDATYRARPVRLAALRVPVDGLGDPVNVVVAETLQRREEAERALIFYVILPQLALLALLVWAMRSGVHAAVAPYRALYQEINERGVADLRPLTADPPTREGHRIAVAINDLMGRLARSLAAQKAFVGDAAHQLRTPLARLKAAAEYALRSDDPARWREALDRMQGSVDSSTRLVNQLLALARAEEASVDGLALARVDLVAIANEVTADFVPAALRKDIDLGFDAAVEVAPCLADAVLAREMLANLVDNAVRYTPPGGHVTVGVAMRDGRVRVTVIDDGPGIPPEEREAVFDRFHRGADAPPGGSGLGLAIVRRVAELMGATVRLEDQGDAPGTAMVAEFRAVSEAGTRAP